MTTTHQQVVAHEASPRTTEHVVVELPYRPLWEIARALIGREPGVAFLDAGGAGEQGRWSLLGWRPRRVLAWPQGEPGALEALRRCLDGQRRAQHHPENQPSPRWNRRNPRDTNEARARVPFCGGWIGWFAYDLGRHFERLPSVARRDPSVPDFVIGEYDMVLAEDRLAGKLFAAGRIDGEGDDVGIRARAEEAFALVQRLVATTTAADREPTRSTGRGISSDRSSPAPLIDRAAYRQAVERILAHIHAGDIYQANFSHRFVATSSLPSADLYERLRSESPAPFGCYLELPGGPEILSASPELFLRKSGNRLQTRPIKGTRPRGGGPDDDARLRTELRDSDKERAELLMITDLLRNDLGRVAAFGSVRVARLRELESHPTVHHAYSVIEAELRDDLGVADVLAAMMPGGSVTGAPKIRAMEILDELEPQRRGPYTGAAGFIGDNGDASLNILIRTLVRRGNEVWYQVGGGIVADSDPDAEYEETLAKGAALRRALSGS